MKITLNIDEKTLKALLPIAEKHRFESTPLALFYKEVNRANDAVKMIANLPDKLCRKIIKNIRIFVWRNIKERN